jgi:hypothetical protein
MKYMKLNDQGHRGMLIRAAKEKCYDVAIECTKNLKNNFAMVGAFSSKQNFIRGDPGGVIQ